MKYFVLLILGFYTPIYSQEMAPDYLLKTGLSKDGIQWQKFPDFSIPFKVVYGGPPIENAYTVPLNKGFSHISQPDIAKLLPAQQRALIYYGVAYPVKQQPWELYRSPWGNDLDLYQNKWKFEYDFWKGFTPSNTGLLDADLFVFDIERQWRTDFEILQLKASNDVPPAYKGMPDAEFLVNYKKDLKTLYAKPFQFFRQLGISAGTHLGSYADAPFYNIFSNIQGAIWQDWQSNDDLLNFLHRTESGGLGGEFYDQADMFFPSAYYYYDYPHPFAGEYLSYLMFQIEVNKAKTNKPVIPFVWLRYSFTPSFQNQFIKPWMAEATAIFPFFCGADGLWLWENPNNYKNNSGIEIYEYFISGLAKIGHFKRFFEGDFELVQRISARDYNENKQPIWRGVVKNNEILIAAHNPFAKSETDEVSIGVSYGDWSQVINLKGYEVKLLAFDMSILANNPWLSDMQVYPNPAINSLNFKLNSQADAEANAYLLNTEGKIVKAQDLDVIQGENTYQMSISDISSGVYFLHLKGAFGTHTKKIVIE